MFVQLMAILGVVLSVLAAVVGPFMIGRSRGPYTAGLWLASVLEAIINLTMAGRIFGWW